MKTIKKIVSSTLGVSVLFINALPVFAKASTDQTLISTSMDSGLKSVDTTASIITDSLDSLTIEKTEQVPVYEVQPEYIPVYSYAEPYVEVQEESTTMTVEEFMALYGQKEEAIPVDTSSQEDAYQQALAEYEAASQMVETTKDVEVEVIEEVTDEEGNVSEVTRTEIQTVTEMIPAGDVETAKAKFDAAKAALDAAQMALDSAKNTTVQADIEIVEPEPTIDEDIQSIIESDSNGNEQTVIDEDVVVKEDVTYVHSGTCGENLRWTLDDNGVLTIDGTGDMADYTVNYGGRPSPWTGYQVNTVIINEGVTGIGNLPFVHCSDLTSVTVPESVTTIKSMSFYGCERLKTAGPIGSGCDYEFGWIASIPDNAFRNCTKLTSITMPDSVTSIGNYTFEMCQSLTNITIPKNVTSIGEYTFSKCGLTSITIPDTVTTIGRYAFYDCFKLKSVVMPNSITSIEAYTFYSCGDLTSITIPDSVTCIGAGAFRGCGGNLSSITIPDSVIRIDWEAFRECFHLTSVTLHNTLTYIGSDAFSDCTRLKTIYYYGSYDQWYNIDKKGAISSDVIIYCRPLSGTCGESVTWKFDDNNNLIISGKGDMSHYVEKPWRWCLSLIENVIINEGVTSIDSSAFSNSSVLTTVNIPKSVRSIGELTFDDCNSLCDVYYAGTKAEWEEKNLYSFDSSVTVHFIDDLPFTDVPKDAWYYNVAKECYETGLINGTSDTTFSPMQEMTRAMVVTILWRMEGQPSVTFNNKFSDVSSKQWYATSISWAEKAGVVHGYGDGTFKPDAAVTREQVAVMLANYATYKGVYVPGTKKLNTYPDGSQVSNWAQAGMKWALTNGIVSGNEEGYLRPKKSATRAEGAAMLLRMQVWMATNFNI